MERWLLIFLVGAFSALCFTQIVDTYYLLLLTLSCFCTLFLSFKYKMFINAFALLSGVSIVMWSANQAQQWSEHNHIDISQLHLSTQLIEGEITSLITESANGLRFNLLVGHFNNQPLKRKFMVRINYQKPLLSFNQGDHVRFVVKLKPAHGVANIGSFSYQKWLKQYAIVATGYVKNDAINALLIHAPTLRQNLYNDLTTHINHPLRAILFALAIGDKSQIDPQLWRVLQATGSQHLMAISGLHLGLIASLGFYLARLLLLISPRFLLSERWMFYLPMVASISLAGFYAHLAGGATPTLRAFVMLLCFYGLRVLQQKVHVLRWLLVSAFCIVIIDPLALLDSSLYLSFAAVMVIFYSFWRYQHCLSRNRKWLRILQSWLLIQFSISILLLPLTLVLFKQVSVLAGLANLLVVPWMSMTAIPLVLLSTIIFMAWPWLGLLLFQWSLLCIDWAFWLLEIFANVKWSIVEYSLFSLLSGMLLVTLCIVIAFRGYKISHALLVFMPLLLMVFGVEIAYQAVQKQTNLWRLTVFEVGHGLAVLIEKQGRAILYDTGASFATGFNFVESTIVPYMKSHRLDYLDKVLISHSDNDHAGGLQYLIDNNLSNEYIFNFKTPTYAHPEPVSKAPPKTLANPQTVPKAKAKSHEQQYLPAAINKKPCLLGGQQMWQGLRIRTLWPETKVGDSNDNSCVIEIYDGEHKVLLPGDISKAVEALLIKQRRLSKVDILIAPHHGSKTSSSFAFINALQPRYVIYSSGYLNRWKMPMASVQYRYSLINTKQINTSTVGMVQFTINKNSLSLKTYRQDLLPFWPWR